MPGPEIDLLAVDRGAVTAPAGCGKTQLIADSLKRHQPGKPILVLTHTNAGVAALRGRLAHMGVPSGCYRLYTIDGWAMRIISTFPARSGHNPEILSLARPSTDYPSIVIAAGRLMESGHLDDLVQASYSRLLVDEYQDCSVHQHAIISFVASLIPTCVVGDPMQAIFSFRGNPLVDWASHVGSCFPPIGELTTPWRWKNAGTERLGHWLLTARASLMAGSGVDLRGAPVEVSWVQLERATAHQQRLVAARTKAPNRNGLVMVLGESISPHGQRAIASQTPGATAVEAVALGDLTNFGQSFDPEMPNALGHLLAFAGEMMTNVGVPEFIRRIQSLARGTARSAPSEAEVAALAFVAAPSYDAALKLLTKISKSTDVRVFRPEVLHSCQKSLRLASQGAVSFSEATVRARELYRHTGRPLSRRSVGSTLLLKGLEADVAVVLYPESMNAKHLYVAITRGSKRLVICSERPILHPS